MPDTCNNIKSGDCFECEDCEPNEQLQHCPTCKRIHRETETDCYLVALRRIKELESALDTSETLYRQSRAKCEWLQRQLSDRIGLYEIAVKRAESAEEKLRRKI